MRPKLETLVLKYIPEALRRKGSIEASSLDHFIDLLKTEAAQEVTAQELITREEGNVLIGSGGFYGIFNYSTRFTSQDRIGREIVYTEFHFSREGTEAGQDVTEREKARIRVQALSELRLEKIKEVVGTHLLAHGPLERESEETKRKIRAEIERIGKSR